MYIVIPYLLVPFFNYSFYYLCLLFCHSVALWSFCHENKFLVCVNIPSNKAYSDSDSDKLIQFLVCVNIPGNKAYSDSDSDKLIQFLVCVNIPSNKAYSDSDSDKLIQFLVCVNIPGNKAPSDSDKLIHIKNG